MLKDVQKQTEKKKDEKVKVSNNDTTEGYLKEKLENKGAIAITEENEGGNEKIGIKVKVDNSTIELDSDNDYIKVKDNVYAPYSHTHSWNDVDKTNSKLSDIEDVGSYTGNASKFLKVKEDESGTEWATVDVNDEKVKADSSDNIPGFLSDKVDNETIEVDVTNHQLKVKDESITADKIATNVDVSSKGFNADKVDGKDVDDSVVDEQHLWTAQKISDELSNKADVSHTHSFTDLSDTPTSYAGEGGKVVKVKSSEDGLEFANISVNDEKVKVSSNDTTAEYLSSKIVNKGALDITEENDGSNESIGFKVKVDDSTIEINEANDYLKVKDGVFASSSHTHSWDEIDKTGSKLSDLEDVSSYSGNEGKFLKVKSDGSGTEWSEISSASDEKVKADSTDPSAGYLEDKVDNTTLEVDTSSHKMKVKDGVFALSNHSHTHEQISDWDSQFNIDFNSNFSSKTTDDLIEGTTNLYFTNERAQDASASMFVDSDSISFSYNDEENTMKANVKVDNNTIEIDSVNHYIQVKDDAITSSKIATNVDVSSKGFNADKVDGKDVNDTITDDQHLWTAQKISNELSNKADISHTHAFNELSDTPSSYTGQGGKVVKVKTTEDGLEFEEVATSDEKVKVSSNDTTANYLLNKIVNKGALDITEENDGGDEDIGLKVKVDNSTIEIDGTNDYLKVKDGVFASSSHTHTFLDLTDTPSDYSGQGGKYLRVKNTEDGIEYATVSGGSGGGGGKWGIRVIEATEDITLVPNQDVNHQIIKVNSDINVTLSNTGANEGDMFCIKVDNIRHYDSNTHSINILNHDGTTITTVYSGNKEYQVFVFDGTDWKHVYETQTKVRMAIGYNAKAVKDSISIGYNARSYGSYSVSLGCSPRTDYGAVSIGSFSYSDFGSVAVGHEASAWRSSVSLGRYATCQSGVRLAIAIGYNSRARRSSEFRIGHNADYDGHGHAWWKRTTSNATLTEIPLAGFSGRFFLDKKEVVEFEIKVIAWDTTNHRTKVWKITDGVATSDGTTATIKNQVKTVVYQDTGMEDCDIDLSAEGNCLKLMVSGLDETNIKWQAVMKYTEVCDD